MMQDILKTIVNALIQGVTNKWVLLIALIALPSFMFFTSCTVVSRSSTTITSERKTTQKDTVVIDTYDKHYKNYKLR